jgi:hypothetical protein
VKLAVLHDVVVKILFVKCRILLSLSKQFLFICDFPRVSDIQDSLYVLFLFFGLVIGDAQFLFEFPDSISVRVR